jgi:hypothetical protein
MRKSIGRGGNGKLKQFNFSKKKHGNFVSSGNFSNNNKFDKRDKNGWEKKLDKIYQKKSAPINLTEESKMVKLEEDFEKDFQNDGEFDKTFKIPISKDSPLLKYYNKLNKMPSLLEMKVAPRLDKIVSKTGEITFKMGYHLTEVLPEKVSIRKMREERKIEEKKEKYILFPHQWLENERSKETIGAKFRKLKIGQDYAQRICKAKIISRDEYNTTCRVSKLLTSEELEYLVNEYSDKEGDGQSDGQSDDQKLNLYDNTIFSIVSDCNSFFNQLNELNLFKYDASGYYPGQKPVENYQVKLIDFLNVKTLMIEKINNNNREEGGVDDSNSDWNMVMIHLDTSPPELDTSPSLSSSLSFGAGDATWISSTKCKSYSECLKLLEQPKISPSVYDYAVPTGTYSDFKFMLPPSYTHHGFGLDYKSNYSGGVHQPTYDVRDLDFGSLYPSIFPNPSWRN